MNNEPSANHQDAQWDSFEECLDLPENFDDDEIDEEESELDEELPVSMEDDFEAPPDDDNDPLDDPLVWTLVIEV